MNLSPNSRIDRRIIRCQCKCRKSQSINILVLVTDVFQNVPYTDQATDRAAPLPHRRVAVHRRGRQCATVALVPDALLELVVGS